MEKARENNEKYKKELPPGSGKDNKDKGDNTVVLTRTDKRGMVRPLPESRHDREKGKKRKRGKVFITRKAWFLKTETVFMNIIYYAFNTIGDGICLTVCLSVC